MNTEKGARQISPQRPVRPGHEPWILLHLMMIETKGNRSPDLGQNPLELFGGKSGKESPHGAHAAADSHPTALGITTT